MPLLAPIAAAFAQGPMPLDRYMALSNAPYYANADPLGADFATAPELTQVFGEVIGLWAADLWDRTGRPAAELAEIGPGRGSLMADALRAAAKAGWSPPVHFVELSLRLRAEQALRVPHANWHEDVGSLPTDAPLIVLANEFLDALPISQFSFDGAAWSERLVANGAGGLNFTPREIAVTALPLPVPSDVGPGAIVEHRPQAGQLTAALAARLTRTGGAALFIDYGFTGPAIGDTLQAMRGGQPVPALAHPGEADLTAHVDFAPLIAAAKKAGCETHGPVPQGAFLANLGFHQRTAALARANPAAAARLQAASLRLTEPAHMGALFKVLAITAPGWPTPAGFDA